MKVAWVGSRWGDLVERIEAALVGHEFIAFGPDQMLDAVAWTDVLIPSTLPVNAEVLDAAAHLKLIQQSGVGLDPIDVKAATARGIPVANVAAAGSGNAESVAELAIFHMLSLARRYGEASANLKQRIVGQPLGTTLYHSTVGIVGVGDIGRALAKRLRAFDVRLLGIKRTVSDALCRELELDWLGDSSQMDYLFAQSDFVALTLSGNESTRQLIGRQQLAQMKPTAFLINVSRGLVLDYVALQEALQRGAIAGAGLDVFWEEPVDPLAALFKYNVSATPHLGAATSTSYQGIADAVAANVRRFDRGERLHNCVNGLA